jgi:hypothetical protein
MILGHVNQQKTANADPMTKEQTSKQISKIRGIDNKSTENE